MATSSITGKIYTDNPFVDELVYYVKQIGVGCIVKNESEADSHETLESLQAADLYLASYEGRARFEYFDTIPAEVLSQSGIPYQLVDSCVENKYNIPTKYRDTVLKNMMSYYVENYVDLNDYYRMLTGYPSKDDTNYIYLDSSLIPEDLELDIDFTLPIHEQPKDIIEILNQEGILDTIKSMYPEADYLRYIDKRIDAYKARKSFNFQLLYAPTTESDVVNAKFKDKFEVNRDYILKTVYSEAFKYESDYYDNIMIILIIIQTMIDLVSEVQEHIAKRDVFDERCIKYIFASNGVPYYTEIPIKYQIAMMKNLNTLIKFKSTSKCMLDICSIFGFDDVRIFKYFLLRDRKLDENGEYVFNYKEETIYEKGDPITEVRNSVIITDETDTITVPFPFDNYIERGNAFLVKVDDTLLAIDDDYTLIGDQITFKNPEILQNASTVEFIFYYNEEGQAEDPIESDPYRIEIVSNSITGSNDTLTYNLTIPDGFTYDHGLINVIVGSVWVNPQRYTIDQENNTITFDQASTEVFNIEGRLISFMYIFSKIYDLKCMQTIHTAGDASEVDIIPEEPYKGCLAAGNLFYLNIGNTYVRMDRYGVTSKAVMFLDSEDRLEPHREAVFNFVYKNFDTPEVVDEEITITAEDQFQREFEITFPFENYLDQGYQMYVRIGISELHDYQYEVFHNTLTFRDASVGVVKGQHVYVRFIYPKNRDIDKFSATFQTATYDKQREFTIPWPQDNYIARNNLFYVQIDGVILDKSKYEIIGDKLYILKIADSLDRGNDLVFCFYYREDNKYKINVCQVNSTKLLEDQDGYPIEYPFFDYAGTGNGFFVTVGSTFIDQSRYRVDNGTLYFTDDTNDQIQVGKDVTFTFIYNTIFEDHDIYVNHDSSKAEITPSGENASVAVPWPYPNFLDDEGNSMIVAVGGHIIDPIDYDIFNDRLYFADLDYIIENYGTNVRFEFHYSQLTEKTIMVDDDEKNYELRFVKVPLTEDVDNYIRNPVNYVDYDQITLADGLWDGELVHEDVKKAFLNTQFSYIRTKYISIDNIESMSDGMLDMPYFFNLFFDDIKLEERLLVQLPAIKANKNFKLNDTLVFMVVLNFEYYGIEDTIMDTMGKILYLRGFNFDADIDTLMQWVHNEMAYDETQIAEFITYNRQLRSYKELLNIVQTDLSFADFISANMFHANNKREYDVFKKIRDACLRLEYSRDFFQVADGTGNYCTTYTEFLRYRDKDLYNKIIQIRAIDDETTRQNTIIDVMDKTIRALDDYLDSDVYKNVFKKFPGSNSDAIKHYVEMMINFFKSYKIELTGINSIYLFNDKYESYIKPIDGLWNFNSELNLDDWVHLLETMQLTMHTTYREYIRPLERLYFDIYRLYTVYFEDDVTGRIHEMFADLLAHILWKDDINICIVDKFYDMILSFTLDDQIDVIDGAEAYSKLRYNTYVSPRDRIYIKSAT